ncbi:putative membrane protein [Nautilia profundicola AmH]|uniref:Membrane protein n=1 Tax=Nautilia profundicola (strain ATCC BAA-1463 / DSM 18972 / AmH) TaxID=598659 RepID=B9LA23_NAUPA|nr:hypothetical protein [Nautilia profundicola]ACM92514.1 putative membrane protein [Nautilia profundicola AmH]
MENGKLKLYEVYYRCKNCLAANKFIIFIFLLLLLARVQISFFNYLDFRYDKFNTLNAKVVNQYIKHGKRGDYHVLKLKTKDLTFYTTSKENLKFLLNENIKLTVVTSKIAFLDYLFTFYAPGFNIRLVPVSKIDEYIEKQHADKKMQNIFKALFLGESIDYNTRQQLSTLGVSHLIALSGVYIWGLFLFFYICF